MKKMTKAQRQKRANDASPFKKIYDNWFKNGRDIEPARAVRARKKKIGSMLREIKKGTK